MLHCRKNSATYVVWQNMLDATLHGFMYAPLSHYLFSICKTGPSCNNTSWKYYTVFWGTTSISYVGYQRQWILAADVTVTSTLEQPHLVLSSRSHSHSANNYWVSLEIPHIASDIRNAKHSLLLPSMVCGRIQWCTCGWNRIVSVVTYPPFVPHLTIKKHIHMLHTLENNLLGHTTPGSTREKVKWKVRSKRCKNIIHTKNCIACNTVIYENRQTH